MNNAYLMALCVSLFKVILNTFKDIADPIAVMCGAQAIAHLWGHYMRAATHCITIVDVLVLIRS
jgi:hypothetical protein